MKLTRKDVVELDHVLKTTNFEMPICARFRYATSINLKKTSAEIEEITAAFPISESYAEFTQKQGAIYTEYGVTKLDDIAEFEEEKQQELEAKLDAIKEEYADAIEEQEAIEAEKRVFLDEEIELNLRQIKIDDMPDIAEDNMYPHWEIWRVIELLVLDED